MRSIEVQPSQQGLLELVSRCVVEPFNRVSDDSVLAVALSLPAAGETEDLGANPAPPVCAAYAESDYCCESWKLHLAELARRARSHWHKCDYSRLCAMVPIVHEDRCLAAVKLAHCGSMSDEDFEHHVEILDILVEAFVASHRAFLAILRRTPMIPAEADAPAAPGVVQLQAREPSHPQVLRALEWIEKHLTDPKLTVGAIARELDIDSSYLGSLFVEQTGQRMSWLIAARRVEMAKTLLATTDRQVKLIAHDTGHANPNWFCHVFRVHTGLTPGQYRRYSRAASAGRARVRADKGRRGDPPGRQPQSANAI